MIKSIHKAWFQKITNLITIQPLSIKVKNNKKKIKGSSLKVANTKEKHMVKNLMVQEFFIFPTVLIKGLGKMVY